MISLNGFLRRHASSLLLWPLLAIATSVVQAQNKGVSYIIGPTAGYMLWDEESGLEKGIFYGGHLGFSFGKKVELSANYFKSMEVTRNLGNLSLFNDMADGHTSVYSSIFEPQNVDINKFGGKLTFNLGSETTIPYVSAGTGIIGIKPDDRAKKEHIYVSVGAGLKFSIDNDMMFHAGAENLWYRYNPANVFLSDDDLSSLGLQRSSVNDVEAGNWAITAGISGHLKGRNRAAGNTMYNDQRLRYSSSSESVNFVIQPTYGVVRFNSKLPYRAEQRVIGGSMGVDFGSYIGVYGFYLRGLEEDGWSSFDSFAMSGGEMKFQLSDADTGIIPFLTFGGGFLDVNNEYEGRSRASDKPFGLAGGGVQFLVGEQFKLIGSAKSVLISPKDVDQISQKDDVTSSWMFNAGFSVTLGSKKKTVPYETTSLQSRLSEIGRLDDKMIEDRVYRRLQQQQLSDTTTKSLERQIETIQNKLDAITATQESAQVPAGVGEAADIKPVKSKNRVALHGLSATTGFNMVGKPFQYLLGARADYGELIGGRLRFAPDFTIGMIKTTTYNVNANLLADIKTEIRNQWKPYVGSGLGLLVFNKPPDGVRQVQATVNILFGVEKPTGQNDALFFEYVNMNLFKFNRLQAGYRFHFSPK